MSGIPCQWWVNSGVRSGIVGRTVEKQLWDWVDLLAWGRTWGVPCDWWALLCGRMVGA